MFILVEIHFVLGDEVNFDELSECQQRLIDVYIEKHPKKKAQLLSAAALHHVKSLEISA